MRILFISHGIYDYDGRLRELIKIAHALGDTTSIYRAIKPPHDPQARLFPMQGSYLGFFRFCQQIFREEGPFEVLFLDNRKAILPGNWLKRWQPGLKIIQDARELYLLKDMDNLNSKIGSVVETIFDRKADITIAANAYRAKAMQEAYHLKETPLVYENLRRLSAGEKPLVKTIEADPVKFNIISTSGCQISRTNDRLVKAMVKLGPAYHLYLVGASSEEDEKTIRQWIDTLALDNVSIVPQLNEAELQHLIAQCQVGIVNYHQKDTNNLYCASGKVYEFLYEGLPVVTTTNPPLVELVEKYQVGACDDGYVSGIRQVKDNYDFYAKNVQTFKAEVQIEDNNQKLIEQLKERLKR